MPRQMGELRRLRLEWNDLVAIAQPRGVRHVWLEELRRRVRVQARQHFQISRIEARDRVRSLRNAVAPFFAPTAGLSTDPALGDTFGVELELIMPPGVTDRDIASRITQAGVLCQVERYGHETRTHWKVVTDVSLGYGSGREVVSPPLQGEAGLETVRKVTRVLTEMGCTVNKNCGLHVHIGAQSHQDINWWKNIVRMQHHFEPAIDSVLSPSRRGLASHWCEPLRINWNSFHVATNLSQLSDAVGQPQRFGARSSYRYRKLNLLSFLQCGTIEFRQHQGTVETMKTEMWVRLLLRLCSKAATTTDSEILATYCGLESLMDFLGCDAVERSYFLERRNHFNQRAA
jgi:hypothetical protein